MRCKACNKQLYFPKVNEDGEEDDMCSECISISTTEWSLLDDKTYQHNELTKKN